MKRKFHHPEPSERELAGPRYWRSPNELANAPEFKETLEKEFPEGASEANENDRRNFLKLMGASAAFAGIGLTGCRMPRRYVLPYGKQPEKMIPGVPIYFASSQPGPYGHIPLIVETHDARPTKIEGNPTFPDFGGATDGFAQASILDLYDPDRLQKSIQTGNKPVSEADVDTALLNLSKKYAESKGEGLALLLQPSTSPTRASLLKKLKAKMPKAVIAEYEPVNFDNPVKALTGISGKPHRPYYHLDNAKRVLSLDSDFLGLEPDHLRWSRDFGKARKVESAADAPKMNRLYAVESTMSLTGAMADHRLRASTSQIPAFAALVCAEIIEQAGGDKQLASMLKELGKGAKVDQKWVTECAIDLAKHKGESLVVAGPHLPVGVHMLVYATNAALNAEGKTIDYLPLPTNDSATIGELVEKINGGSVESLIIMGGNPVYDAPADVKFGDALSKVDTVIRHGYYDDETSEKSKLTIASSHYLESWGDGRAYCGAYVPVQPMILPLFETKTENEVLAGIAGMPVGEDGGYQFVRETFSEISGKKDDLTFNEWLTEGVYKHAKYKPGMPTPKVASFGIPQKLKKAEFAAPALSEKNVEFRIMPSSHAWDGRYNNNGWLMECPDPMTKLTWDNVISVSPKMAKALDIYPKPIRMDEMGQLHINANTFEKGKETSKIAKLTVNGVSIEGPLHIQPGMADYTVGLTLGFGRRKTGRVGTAIHYPNKGEGIGFDVYPFVTTSSPALATGGTVEVLDKTFQVANTQEHWSMEGRAIIREANVDEYAKNPNFVDKMGMEAHSPPILGTSREEPLSKTVKDIPRGGSAYKTPEFTADQQWGMNIDLNTCTACNACVLACQSENNIPIVGKDQVLRGREMHWIRLDRYYASGPDADTLEIPEDPQVNFMGMACQHCELAPCESVCPVNATVHDDQGLNTMAYNRCVGTRYCANNCPYKVRRFNFFDYNKRERGDFYKGPLGKNVDKTEESQFERMQKNPDVTVRMRGVMEKCTYCVQRIEEAKINQLVVAKNSNNTNVPDGTIKTACQQVCPTDAITFGDLADETTEVYKAKMSDRDYSVLGYLNVRPRTTYSAKLRNPNPQMPDYTKQPLARLEYEAKGGHADHGDHGSHDTHGPHAEPAHH